VSLALFPCRQEGICPVRVLCMRRSACGPSPLQSARLASCALRFDCGIHFERCLYIPH
jgi:hypothetical protein